MIVGSDEWMNEFRLSKTFNASTKRYEPFFSYVQIVGGERTTNIFRLINALFSGSLWGGKNATNILDVSGLDYYALFLHRLIDFDRTQFVKAQLTQSQAHFPAPPQKASFHGMDPIVLSANITVVGDSERMTFYVKPAPGYSKIKMVSTNRVIIFPETTVLRSCDPIAYSPQHNVLSIQCGHFTLDIARYFSQDSQTTQVEIIDQQSSIIKPLVDPQTNATIRFFHLQAETGLTYPAIPSWYRNLTQAHEDYHVYGSITVKHSSRTRGMGPIRRCYLAPRNRVSCH